MSCYYITENTYAVCTNQLDATPQMFGKSREKATIFINNLHVLTVIDRKIEKPLICKIPVNQVTSFISLGLGLALALGIGFVFIGAALLIALCFAAKYIQDNSCTTALKSGFWSTYNTRVLVDKEFPLTELSILVCSNSGGLLKPFFSRDKACNAAESIAFGNRVELGINSIVSFFMGYSLPESLMTIGAKNFIAQYCSGTVITLGILNFETETIRNFYNYNDDRYGDIGSPPSYPIDKPADFNSTSSFDNLKKANANKEIIKNNLKIKEEVKPLNGKTTDQIKYNDKGKQFFKKVNKGVYGKDMKKELMKPFQEKVSTNSSNVKKVNDYTSKQINKNLKEGSKNLFEGTLFFLPFITPFYTEHARYKFFKELEEDLKREANVITENPYG